MNCTKEESKILVDRYWEREWERIKSISFPKIREHDITDKECIREIVNLRDNYKNNKSLSKTIMKFHSSIIYSNRKGYLSPYDYWQKLKEDSELFKVFYENRLRCSDWFKEKNGSNMQYLEQGYVPEFIYGIGLTTSGKAPRVSYFKPALAKNIITKYLNNFSTIFDPCSGYSGRLIGALCAGKNYIGQEINDITLNESVELYSFISKYFYKKCELKYIDSLSTTGEYECMLTCTPYGNIEEWLSFTGKITSNLSCDEWINELLNRYKCKKYIFVVDDSISKYRNYIVENLTNTSHFGSNKEHIVEIQK